jgi:(p)ppGpp synthase/HD superfamily hydrolase
MYREEVITTIMYHDLREDYHITEQEIRDRHPLASPEFINCVCRAVENMTKEWRGEKKDEAALFAAMADDPVASIAKGCDRIHNVQSMIRVFKLEKQKAYIQEVFDLFFPMLKTARKNFPHQSLAYENIKHMLLSQIEMLMAMHEFSQTGMT